MRFKLMIIIFIVLLSIVVSASDLFRYSAHKDTLLPVINYVPDTSFTIMSYSLPNNPRCELIYSNHLYLGAGAILQIYDLPENGIPVLTGEIQSRGVIEDMEHDGEYLYVANGWRGITIYDGTDFVNPQEIGHYQTETSTFQIGVCRDSLYYIEGYGLGIVDIHDRYNPILARNMQVDTIHFMSYPQDDLFFYENYLVTRIEIRRQPSYMCFAVFSLDSPDTIPNLINTINLRSSSFVAGFKLFEDRLYICMEDSLAIYQFNPFPDPVHLSSFRLSGKINWFDEGYINGSRYGYVSYFDNYPGYDSTWTKITKVLLDDLSNPQIVDSSDVLNNVYYTNILQHNEYTYAVCHHGWYMEGYDPGLYVYRWNDTGGAEVIHHNRQYSFCTAVAAKDDIAYAGTYYENVTILDMQDKKNPRIAGEIPGFQYIIQMKIIDDRLYMLTPAKLAIFDISDPFDPVELGRLYLQVGGYSVNFHIHGNLVYINYWWLMPGGQGWVLIADISDPARITVYHDGQHGDSPNPSHLNFPYLYLLSYRGGVGIYNVADSTNPVRYSGVNCDWGSSACYSQDTLLYLFGGVYELWNIANMYHPVRINQWLIRSRYDDVQYADGKLFMADIATSYDMYVWDINASPYEPYHVGYFHADPFGFMSIDLPYVYIPSAEYGLVVLRYNGPTSINDDKPEIPEKTGMLSAYPNPFNNTINFEIPGSSTRKGNLSIYDVTGRLIKAIEISSAGTNKIVKWDGTNNDGNNVSSGIYFASYKGDNISKVAKVMLLK